MKTWIDLLISEQVPEIHVCQNEFQKCQFRTILKSVATKNSVAMPSPSRLIFSLIFHRELLDGSIWQHCTNFSLHFGYFVQGTFYKKIEKWRRLTKFENFCTSRPIQVTLRMSHESYRFLAFTKQITCTI